MVNVIVILSFISLLFQFGQSITYDNSEELQPEYKISWKVEGDIFNLKLEVQTTGWIGFGIAEQTSGSMPGADIMVAMVNSKGETTISDRYATAKAQPIEDDCPNWDLVSGMEASGWTIVEVRRVLNTNDTQDRQITPGDLKIIYAYGTTDVFGYHGATRFFTTIQVIESVVAIPEDDGTWESMDLKNTYALPNNSTVYACTTYNLNLDTDMHIIKFEMLMDMDNVDYVHHMLLFRCESNSDKWYQDRLNNPEICTIPDEVGSQCHEIIWGWAHGSIIYYLPENIGFRAGPSEGSIHYLEIQMHYDNPNMVPGIIDSSGVRITYTPTLREFDAGVLTLGDPSVAGTPIPPGKSQVEYEYSCSSDCTSTQLSNNINVFGFLIHMHEIGARGWTKQWRGNKDLGYVSRIEYYDYGFQAFQPIDVVVKPGDRLQTHCIYDSTTRSTYTPFSTPSEAEMCMDFLMYYPRIPDFAYCGFGYAKNRNFTFCGNPESGFVDEFNPTAIDPKGGNKATFGLMPPVCKNQLTSAAASREFVIVFAVIIISVLINSIL